MRKRLFAIILLTMLVSWSSACGAIAPATSHARYAPIRVEYTQWWGDYTLLVAKEKGFFEKYGVEVEPVYYPVFRNAYSDLAAGLVDVALISGGDVISINRHTPIKIIGLSDDGGYMPIVSSPDVNSVGELRGKTIGTLVGTHYEILVSNMLASAYLKRSDVTIKNINPEDALEAMEKDEIQAAFLWEPFTSEALAQGGRILYPTNQTLRLFPDTLAFRKEIIDQRPEETLAFMRAWFDAVEFRLKNPEETRAIAAKYLGVDVEQIQADPSLKIYTYEDNLAMYSSLGERDNFLVTIQRTADYLLSAGIISNPPDIETIIMPDFLLQLQ